MQFMDKKVMDHHYPANRGLEKSFRKKNPLSKTVESRLPLWERKDRVDLTKTTNGFLGVTK